MVVNMLEQKISSLILHIKSEIDLGLSILATLEKHFHEINEIVRHKESGKMVGDISLKKLCELGEFNFYSFRTAFYRCQTKQRLPRVQNVVSKRSDIFEKRDFVVKREERPDIGLNFINASNICDEEIKLIKSGQDFMLNFKNMNGLSVFKGEREDVLLFDFYKSGRKSGISTSIKFDINNKLFYS